MNENTQASKTLGNSPSEFIRTLYPKGLDGFVEVRALTRDLADRYPDRRWISRATDFAVVDAYCKFKSQSGYDIYYSVCAHSERDGKKDTVAFMPGMWVDVDTVDDAAKVAIKSFPLKPSVVVSSGRGLHLYWLFPEPIKIDKTSFLYLEILLKLLCVRCKGDTNTCDVSRILRLPGTLNQKNRKTVTVIKYSPVRYTIWQILDALI